MADQTHLLALMPPSKRPAPAMPAATRDRIDQLTSSLNKIVD